MKDMKFLSDALYSKYGNVTRARGCFLYTAKNVRLTDCFQENGRAILGWGGTSAFTMLKNVLSRGITGSYECGYEHRLEKAVSDLFASSRKVSVFSSRTEALKCAAVISPEKSFVYRPWGGADVKWYDADCIVFEPTLPWTQGIYLLAVKSELDVDLPSVKLAAPVTAAVTRSIYDLMAALQNRQEKDWFLYDKVLNRYFRREGPYLYPTVAKERYHDFVLHCLDMGVVINPVFEEPSIVPFGADPGVFNNLKNHPFGE